GPSPRRDPDPEATMSRFRFGIANLLGLVLFLAVACAALRAASDLWESLLFSLALGLLVASVLGAVHRTGGRRAFWLGFALFGGAYLLASLIPPVESRLLTTKGLAYLDASVLGREQTFALTLSTDHPAQPNVVQTVTFSPQGKSLTTSHGGL